MEEVCLHPRQKGWAAGAWRRGCARRLWREQENRAESAQRGKGGRWGWEDRARGQGEELVLKLDRPSPRTIRPRIVWVWSKAQGGLKLYVIFSYTRDPPCSPDGFNHWRKKAALLVCMKSRSWESLGKAACTARLPSN